MDKVIDLKPNTPHNSKRRTKSRPHVPPPAKKALRESHQRLTELSEGLPVIGRMIQHLAEVGEDEEGGLFGLGLTVSLYAERLQEERDRLEEALVDAGIGVLDVDVD